MPYNTRSDFNFASLGRNRIFGGYNPRLAGHLFSNAGWISRQALPVFKFRSMTDAKDPNGELLPDDARLTRLGRFLRSLSLDELPELFNVIKGEMSLVGPRPLLVQYLERYSPEQARRHNVLPGITGWAQINGRNALTWDEKFSLDVWYVDHCSFWLDVKILLMTFWKVIIREGISQPGQATAEEFMGNQGDTSKWHTPAR